MYSHFTLLGNSLLTDFQRDEGGSSVCNSSGRIKTKRRTLRWHQMLCTEPQRCHKLYQSATLSTLSGCSAAPFGRINSAAVRSELVWLSTKVRIPHSVELQTSRELIFYGVIFIGSLADCSERAALLLLGERGISSVGLGRCQTLLRVRQTLIKLSGCLWAPASFWLRRVWLLSTCRTVPGCLVFMGHGTPSAVAGGSVA